MPFRLQAEAIKNIKIDKITVWEGGSGSGEKTSTANFISGLYKSVPPLQEMFNMAGMELPDYLKGKSPDEINKIVEEIKGKEKDAKKEKPVSKPTSKPKKKSNDDVADVDPNPDSGSDDSNG